MLARPCSIALATLIAITTTAFSQTSSIPALNSNSGAAYTLYLNFGGFDFTGTWGASGRTPGLTPAYDTNGNPGVFTAEEIQNIQTIWSRTAEKYTAFNINVTTVDPAVAAGQAGTDFSRQHYYESTPKLMQTVIGGSNTWYSTGAGGVSYLGVAANGGNPGGNGGAGSGFKTNWAFTDDLGSGYPKYVAEAVSHENGHALGLSHQAEWAAGNPPTLVNPYDYGTSTGNAIAPIMGVGYDTDRSTWRVGATPTNSSPTAQNDVLVIQNNPGMRLTTTSTGFVDSGIGHSRVAATALPVLATAIDSATAKGLITPLSSTSPNAIGSSNYTADVFKFTVAEGQTATLNVILHSGRSTLTAGVADEGATLNATLRLLDANGAELFISNSNVFTETIAVSSLASGTYYLEVSSAGGFTDSYGNTYFDMGSYFMTGSLVPVPEPATVFGVGCSVLALGGFIRKRFRSKPAELTTAA